MGGAGGGGVKGGGKRCNREQVHTNQLQFDLIQYSLYTGILGGGKEHLGLIRTQNPKAHSMR